MRLLTRALVTATMLYSVAASNAAAQATAHPNFSGMWVLDASKSIVDGQLAVPTSANSTIVQHGDTITVDREASAENVGVMKTHAVWGLDGKPWKNTVPVDGQDTEYTSVLSWDKDVLVIRTTLQVQGTDVEQIDRWTMGADGKTFVIYRAVSAMGQEIGSTTTTYNKKS